MDDGWMKEISGLRSSVKKELDLQLEKNVATEDQIISHQLGVMEKIKQEPHDLRDCIKNENKQDLILQNWIKSEPNIEMGLNVKTEYFEDQSEDSVQFRERLFYGENTSVNDSECLNMFKSELITQFQCKQCDIVFTNNADLLNHMNSHPIMKMHECGDCGKTFKYFSLLKLHMKIHTGETPFQCQLCDAAFRLSDDHKTHMGIHTENQNKELPICKYKKCETTLEKSTQKEENRGPTAIQDKSPWKSKSHGHFCAAINCRNNRKSRRDLSFFCFPKDKERCRKWVQNTRREDLQQRDCEHLSKSCYLCANHFESSQFMNEKRNKLIWNAVPTVFNVPNPPRSLTGKRAAIKAKAKLMSPRKKKKDSRCSGRPTIS